MEKNLKFASEPVPMGTIARLKGLQGFRGSDWDNSGKTLYVVKFDSNEGYDSIYRSTDRGETFTRCKITYDGKVPSRDFPVTIPSDPDKNRYFYYAISIMIPTKLSDDETDKMLIAPIGSQKLYLCSDISQDTLAFISVTHDDSKYPGIAGVFNGFAECKIEEKQYLYMGWYGILTQYNKAFLYNAIGDYKTWNPILNWEARNIHAVRVNPYNNYLYVVLGEPDTDQPKPGEPRPPYSDAAKIMRIDLNNWRNSNWVCVTDTWKNKVHGDLGLCFSTLEFIPNSNRVVLGECTDLEKGRIFYFDDDGRDGSNPALSLPFTPTKCYTADNKGEFWLGAVRMGNKLYFASMFLEPISGVLTTQCVSTLDGVNWFVEKKCGIPPKTSNKENATLGVFTYHPERGGRLIFSLSSKDSYYIDM